MREIDPAEVRRVVREVVDRALEPTPESGRLPAPRDSNLRRVAIGSDHGGFELKEAIKRFLSEELGVEPHDCGTFSTAAVDYPDFAAAVAREVSGGRASRGIVVDSAGIGSTMAANKIPGVRCALCHDDATVLNCREHNDANVLAIGAKVVHRGQAMRMVRLFLSTSFGGGRHERRVQKIMALERGGR